MLAHSVFASGGAWLVEPYISHLPRRAAHLEFARFLSPRRIAPIFLPASIGEYAGDHLADVRGYLSSILAKSPLIMARDAETRSHLRSMLPAGAESRVLLVPDAAFALVPPGGRHRSFAPLAQPRRIAVSVRRWDYDGPGVWESYVEVLASFVANAVRVYDARVEFISSCQGIPNYANDADTAMLVTERARALLAPSLSSAILVDKAHYTPQELIKRLGSFDVVVATRMHVAILALCAGVPILPIAYEFKMFGLMRLLSYERFARHSYANVSSHELSDDLGVLLTPRSGEVWHHHLHNQTQRYASLIIDGVFAIRRVALGSSTTSCAHKSVTRTHIMPQLQHSHATELDRYPTVFQKSTELMAGRSDGTAKILSFGCPVGLEAKSLALKYFPDSMIVGVDVDEAVLSQARSNTAHLADRVHFFNSAHWPLSTFGDYDIVFATSVLCLNPPPSSISNLSNAFPFSSFETALVLIDSVLREGGLLVAVNTNYRLEDTSIAHRYHAALPRRSVSDATLERQTCHDFVPLIDATGTEQLQRWDGCMWWKRRVSEGGWPDAGGGG